MKTIAYYISDYGYGHASRSIAIIREILQRDLTINIVICHSFAMEFIQKSLNSNRVQYRFIKTDVGYFLKNDSIEPDLERLNSEFQSFTSEMEDRIKVENDFLIKNKIDLVVSDISPLPFEAADMEGIPSIGISNFTWYTAYQGLINEANLKSFKDAYQKMTYFFTLAGSQEREWYQTKMVPYGFFSREIDSTEVQRIRLSINPTRDKKIIFVGLGMKIGHLQLEKLPIWESEDTVFLVSSNVQVSRNNVFKIPDGYTESQNFVAASDLLISKAGWSMLGEATTANVKVLILNRNNMKEDQNTIQYMKNNYNSETVEWDQFQTLIGNNIKVPISNNYKKNTINHKKDIAQSILKILYVVDGGKIKN